MINETQMILIRPFCDDKHFMTAAHFRFECETLKIKIDGILYLFLNFQNRAMTSSGNE